MGNPLFLNILPTKQFTLFWTEICFKSITNEKTILVSLHIEIRSFTVSGDQLYMHRFSISGDIQKLIYTLFSKKTIMTFGCPIFQTGKLISIPVRDMIM